MKILYCLSVLLLLSLTSCSKEEKTQTSHAVPVSCVKVVRQTIPADFTFVGVAKSSHIVELRARVEGYLEKITYDEGGLVHKGDLMFVLDQRPFIAQLDIAKGELERQQAVLWNAKQSLQRMVPLYEANAVSQRDYDNAIAEELSSEANVTSAAANVQKDQINLDFASISAPVTGMASRAQFREGALIAPGPDSLLTNIYVIDPIWVNFNVSSGDLLKAQKEIKQGRLKWPKGMQFDIEVVLANNTTMPAYGKIDFTDPALQQSTGTMLVRSVMPNPKMVLRPGQFTQVVVKGAYRPDVIIVPKTAVMQGRGGMFVYVVDSDNVVDKRLIEPGEWYQDFWIIYQGLQEGDVVIAKGGSKVQKGSKVEITSFLPDSPKKKESVVASS